MRKLKLQMHISVDGFVAGPNGELDWIFTGSGQEPVIALADSCDTILLGRKMAQGFIDHWERVLDHQTESREQPLAQRMVRMRKVVFSRTESAIRGRNAEITNDDLATKVRALKNEPGKDLLVYGGAEFVSSLIDQNLIDEYHLFVIPVALGDGLRIFHKHKKLILKQSTAFRNSETISVYVPA